MGIKKFYNSNFFVETMMKKKKITTEYKWRK